MTHHFGRGWRGTGRCERGTRRLSRSITYVEARRRGYSAPEPSSKLGTKVHLLGRQAFSFSTLIASSLCPVLKIHKFGMCILRGRALICYFDRQGA